MVDELGEKYRRLVLPVRALIHTLHLFILLAVAVVLPWWHLTVLLVLLRLGLPRLVVLLVEDDGPAVVSYLMAHYGGVIAGELGLHLAHLGELLGLNLLLIG